MRNAYKILAKKNHAEILTDKKTLMNIKRVFKFLCETFLILRRIEQYDQNVYYIGLRAKYPYYTCSCWVLLKVGFYGQIFENTHIKFHENPSSWSPLVPC